MSKHDRVFDLFDTDLHLPKRLANRKVVYIKLIRTHFMQRLS